MMLYRRTLGAISLVGLLGACSLAACSATGNGQTGPTGGAGGSGGHTAMSSSSGMGGDPAFDSGANGDGSGTSTCQYVDILFLIDNSASMGPKQKKLAQAWPLFVDAIYAVLPAGIDLHVGLTTTSFYKGSTAESTINCMSGNSQQDIAAHFITPGTMND